MQKWTLIGISLLNLDLLLFVTVSAYFFFFPGWTCKRLPVWSTTVSRFLSIAYNMSDFKAGLCGCCEDCNICLCSFCCPCVQFGKNVHAMHESGGSDEKDLSPISGVFPNCLIYCILTCCYFPFVYPLLCIPRAGKIFFFFFPLFLQSLCINTVASISLPHLHSYFDARRC